MDHVTEQLARELERPAQLVQNVIDLLDEGNTIPFIARYRKEAHGAMDDEALRTLEERLHSLREAQLSWKRSIMLIKLSFSFLFLLINIVDLFLIYSPHTAKYAGNFVIDHKLPAS